jgi:hypothetical protein
LLLCLNNPATTPYVDQFPEKEIVQGRVIGTFLRQPEKDSMVDVEKQYDAAVPNNGAKESDEIGRQLDGVDPVYEAKIVRKLDLYIIPVVMLLYLFSFLDR